MRTVASKKSKAGKATSKNGTSRSTRKVKRRSAADSSTAPTHVLRAAININPFHQRLARLTYHQACTLLGPEGKQLLASGSQCFEIETERDVFLGGDLYRVKISDSGTVGERVVVTLTMSSHRDRQLQVNCDRCTKHCEHKGAAVAHLLEAKSTMGLAAPPDEAVALENLTEEELVQRALAERKMRALKEKMHVRSVDKKTPWTDYIVNSQASGKTYRVALRGHEAGQSYCSCPDFRTNHLGTCKHILHVLEKVCERFSMSKMRVPYRRKHLSVRVQYQQPPGLLFNLPESLNPSAVKIIGECASQAIDGCTMMDKIQSLEQAGHAVHVYPDAEELIQRDLTQRRLASFCADVRRNPQNHPLRKKLLNVELLPYQLDGIAFAVGAGRTVLADDMGLGKTIQAIGVAELLAQQAEIQRVLVVCPASLKSQWKSEIGRFTQRDCQLVVGSAAERVKAYQNEVFFTVCNYEQVMRDFTPIEAVAWDLIILDEGQRIKNWESKTSQVIRALRSPFAIVLSGTPLENRLDELFTVVQFVDSHRLGPAYRFFHRHRVVDDRGKPVGYQRLDELRSDLRPILLRRTRAEVAKQLPHRIDEVVRISPTEEQQVISNNNLKIACQIAAKKFLTEMDLLRLQKALLLARMAADSTFLVDHNEPEYSSKLERLSELLESLLAAPDRKIVLFSEWRTMLDRIELRLARMDCEYVRLDGQIPQKQRPALVQRFQEDPKCRMILMTNAGSTGLNLQSANTVINVDLPWNPAVLEQRIARAHRMGQKNPVHVYKLVTENTIEERLLDTLASKQDLLDAALDFDSDVNELSMRSGITNIREKLEKILLPPPPAEVDASRKQAIENLTESVQARRERVSAASGQLLGAALNLVGQLVAKEATQPEPKMVDDLVSSLSECVERDSQGRPQLTISLANDDALRGIAETLAMLLRR